MARTTKKPDSKAKKPDSKAKKPESKNKSLKGMSCRDINRLKQWWKTEKGSKGQKKVKISGDEVPKYVCGLKTWSDRSQGKLGCKMKLGRCVPFVGTKDRKEAIKMNARLRKGKAQRQVGIERAKKKI